MEKKKPRIVAQQDLTEDARRFTFTLRSEAPISAFEILECLMLLQRQILHRIEEDAEQENPKP